MENTLENKVAFFAMYINQNVLVDPTNTYTWLIPWVLKPESPDGFVGNLPHTYPHVVNSHLELKALSSIGDEAAIEVAKVVESKFSCIGRIFVERIGQCVVVTAGVYRVIIGFENSILQIRKHNEGPDTGEPISTYEHYLAAQKLISMGYYIGDGREAKFGWVKLREEVDHAD